MSERARERGPPQRGRLHAGGIEFGSLELGVCLCLCVDGCMEETGWMCAHRGGLFGGGLQLPLDLQLSICGELKLAVPSDPLFLLELQLHL